MLSEEKWATSVHILVLNFRDALVALTYYMDRAKIGWRDEAAYDDWDEIAQSLYKNMILRSVQFSLESEEGLITPDYGTALPSYEDMSFVEVVAKKSQSDGYLVFIGFSTLVHPFDQVRCQPVSGFDLRVTGDPFCMQLKEAQFEFIICKRNRGRERLSDIMVRV
jgi:hypothetical protein